MSIYKEIVNYLENEIITGKYAKGNILPSESELCKMFSTSRITVRKALDILIFRGMIYKVHRKGSFVSEPNAHRDYTLGGFAEIMKQKGVTFQTKVLLNKIIPSDVTLAQCLSIPENSKVFQLKRMRFIYEKAICIESIYLSLDRFPDLDSFDFEKVSLYDTLQNQYGIIIKRIKQQISTATLSGKDAKMLFDKKSGTSLFIKSFSYDEMMQPVDMEIGHYNGSRYTIDTMVQ